MKFKFRADSEDLLIFIIFAIFLLYIVAISVVNIHTFAAEGHLSGLNPIPAFAPEYLFSTIFLYFLFLLGLFASVSSMFFDREKGFGITTDKKDKGYSRWAKEKEIQEELECVPIQAKNSKKAGVPLILNSKEMWVDNGEYHSLVIGATGSGKTQTVILPMVHSLAKAKESMIITDPKGEIYEKTSTMLKASGYQILLLNFRDPQNGNAWNPMTLPYQMYKSGNQDKAIELLDDLALNILYDESNKNADPFWEKTSADYFSGVALGLFEDAKEDEININSISLATTVGEEKFGGSTYIKEYFSLKDPGSAAAINASSTIMAPSETKGSILSVFKQKVKLFASRENLSEMLSHSDISLESIGEKPTAVFIVIQDEKKTYHSLVTILLKQIYETLISTAQKHGGKLPVRTNFLLDEFANMPPLKDVTTMITAARSRKIRFTMIIQNFAQLDDVYGKEEAETIRGNCGNIIYLITTELKALEEISKMCGEVKSKKDDKTASTPLVTVSDLQRMKQFEVIILRMRKQPFKTKFTPYYKLDWGVKYPPAKYPVRKKREVKTFDIKEFVKTAKKNKLLDMMNNPDGGNRPPGGLFGGGTQSGLGFPPSFSSPFGQRKNPFDGVSSPFPPSPSPSPNRNDNSSAFSNFNPFKPSANANFGDLKSDPFGSSFPPTTFDSNKDNLRNDIDSKIPPIPKPSTSSNDKKDDLGFNVDDLVKKIDARIAELEEEEKQVKRSKGIDVKEESVANAASDFRGSGDVSNKNFAVSATDLEKKEHDNFGIKNDSLPATTNLFESQNLESGQNSSRDNNSLPKNKAELPESNLNLPSTVNNPVSTLNLDDDQDDDFFDDFFDN